MNASSQSHSESAHRSPAPGVAVHGARLLYEGRPLFDGLDFALEPGRWTCLLGPSGVGKSSLVRLIAGLATEFERRDLVR